MYYLFVFGNIIATILPRNMCYGIARFLATLRFYLAKKDREAVLYNLEPIIEDKEKRRACAKKVFINFSYYLADFFRKSDLNQDFIKKYVKIDGLDNLNRCISSERGVIVVTAHIGNYELAAAITAFLGYPIFVVALPHKDKRVNNFFDSRRKRVGIDIISTGSAIKGCFSVLKKGKMLALLGDRDFSGGGVKVKMFSRYGNFPRGAAFFALKTGAIIVPVFLVRENTYNYRFTFESPIEYDSGKGDDEAEIIGKYISRLEKYITKYPDQWYLFEKFWI